MNHSRLFASGVVLAAAMACAAIAGADGTPTAPPESAATQVVVGPGVWKPLYPAEGEEKISVEAFRLDVRPVTNGEFLAFVREHPKWRRDRIPSLFATENYLPHWAGPTELGDSVGAEQPVTYVSWWAARAYCEARDARLPTEREWELAAMASEDAADATGDPAFLARILAWYSKAGSSELADSGSGPANVWGVRDLHGLIWEWVDDFQSALISVDSREDGSVDTARFCGAGAVSASVKEDYAAFMRLAFRASLHANYTTRNLGFRCANDLEQGSTP